MEWLRDQYLDYMTGRRVERPMFVELFGPLVGLDEEWRAQGATEEEINLTAFGFDYVRRAWTGGNTGMLGAHPDNGKVLEDTAEYLIQIDRLGRTVKLCKGKATIPLPLDYPVKSMDDWLRLKPKYEFDESRIDREALVAAKAARDGGAMVVAGIPGGFDEPRQLLGEEELCIAYYEEPELIHDMLQTMGKTAERVLDIVSKEVTVDQLSVHEDLAGKSGALVGPRQIEEFIKPYYRRCWDLLQSRGATIFQQDSDGNMNGVMDAFLDCGLTCMYPMEPAAGMDIVALRKQYGARLMMKGGLDKFAVREGPDAIERELAYKMQPCMLTGGMIFGLDHRIPNGTSIEHYRTYVRRAREMLDLEPAPEPGWARMAF